MSTAQPGPRPRQGSPGTPGRSTTASTSGDGSRPNLPRTGAGPSLSADWPARRTGQIGVTQAAVTRPPLAGADLYDWMALRRVSGGGIARMDDHWLEYGRRIPGYIADALAVLCDNGVVALAEPDVSDMRRAALSDSGTLRYQQLCRQRQTAPRPPAAESPHTARWLADNPHARNVVQSVRDTLAELEQSGHHPGLLAALRRVLAHHQPTPAGRCRVCGRFRWRRRRFPCIVWHQVHTEFRAGRAGGLGYPSRGGSREAAG